MPVKYLTVHYRAATSTKNVTLEQLLRECIEAELEPGVRFSEAPADRVMIQEKGGRELLLNEFADVTDGMAGIICEVIPGLLQPVLRRTEQQKQLTKNTISTIFEIADQAAGDKEDFVQGICYFYVRHNHLLFVTLKGFRKADVEPFFNWILGKFGKGQLALAAAIDRAQVGNDIGRVSKFRIRGRSGDGHGVALGVEKEVRRRLGAQTVAWSKAEEVVQAILPQRAFERLINSLGDKNRLVADVQWSVAGPRDKEVKEAIQDVVTELANLDDGLVSIEGQQGEIKEGSVILETNRPFEVALETTILIDFDHATDRLVSTYARWVEDQKLTVR